MRHWLRAALIALAIVLPGAGGPPRAAAPECTTLACPKCQSICQASCDAELKKCESGSTRGCPRNYRSCLKACPSMLCAQCLPVQYGSDNRKFLPGKTELCRTPGTWDKTN